MVTAKLPPFAHSGDNADVLVSHSRFDDAARRNADAHRAARPNNLVYATAQGPISVGGFSADTGTGNSISKNFVTAGRVPEGAVIARDMITNLQQDRKASRTCCRRPITRRPHTRLRRSTTASR